MRYILPLLLSLQLFAQSDTATNPTEDLTRNRLFMMSTGQLQPQGVVGVQVHELIGYQVVYSPTNYIQLNLGYGIPRQFVLGGKLQLIENYGFIHSVSVNVDALLFVHHQKDNVFYFVPNVIGTVGSDDVNFSLSLTPLEMEKFKYDPPQREPSNWYYEGDGFVKEKMMYKIPAIVQAGLMFHSASFRLKFIIETHYVYEGKRDYLTHKMSSLGVRKYWASAYLDVAVYYFINHETRNYSEAYPLPFLSFGFFL